MTYSKKDKEDNEIENNNTNNKSINIKKEKLLNPLKINKIVNINPQYIINDLEIDENTKKFSYRGKNYYLYTPTSQLKDCNIVNLRCNLYRIKKIFI